MFIKRLVIVLVGNVTLILSIICFICLIICFICLSYVSYDYLNMKDIYIYEKGISDYSIIKDNMPTFERVKVQVR